jgi:hypothetical protein
MNPARRNFLKLFPVFALAPFCGALAAEGAPKLIRIYIPGPHSLPF